MNIANPRPENPGVAPASAFSIPTYLSTIALAFAMATIASQSATAQTLTAIYSFKGDPDGSAPSAKVIRDAAGNLYGTTVFGGTNNGTVFKINAQGVETILHTFTDNPDGSLPWADLIRDEQGSLYGTTSHGGAFNFGTVFKISSAGKESVLYSFSGSPDGASPYAGLILDSAGNLYGTTLYGGTGNCKGENGGIGCGTVFKLDTNGVETVLYSFAGGTDGEFPASDLIRDSQGNLYGTTGQGGAANCPDPFEQGCGTLFMISETGVETILHSFAGYPADGEGPASGVIIGAGGNLYGTTLLGGTHGLGTVFEVTRTGTEKLIYSFGSVLNDGRNPSAGLAADPRGNLYGTTQAGGGTGCAGSGCGTLFRVTMVGKEISLPLNESPAGCVPSAPLIRDAAGNFYGTTSSCGLGYGTVFRVTP